MRNVTTPTSMPATGYVYDAIAVVLHNLIIASIKLNKSAHKHAACTAQLTMLLLLVAAVVVVIISTQLNDYKALVLCLCALVSKHNKQFRLYKQCH